MALNKPTAAAGAQPAAGQSSPSVTNPVVDQLAEKEVVLDDAGNPVNPGDANSKPLTSEVGKPDEEKPLNPVSDGSDAADKAKAEKPKSAPAKAKKAVVEEEDGDDEEEEEERLVKVTNLSERDQRQPSTGLWIGAGKRVALRPDGWLENQIKAGILTKKKA